MCTTTDHLVLNMSKFEFKGADQINVLLVVFQTVY